MARRLAAIFAADVVGYSRLMGEDEESTLAAVRVNREEVVEPKIEFYRGHVIKCMGDGMLAEFRSVVDALLVSQPDAVQELRNYPIPSRSLSPTQRVTSQVRISASTAG